MKKNLAVFFIFLFLFSGCNNELPEEEEDQQSIIAISSPSEDTVKFIRSYTSGEISKKSDIRIELAQPMELDTEQEGELPSDLLHFEPRLKGSLTTEGKETLLFSPANDLSPGEEYTASLDLDVLMGVEQGEIDPFSFNFSVIKQDLAIRTSPVTMENTERGIIGYIQGEIETADIADNKKVESILSLPSNGLELSWEHEGNLHRFTLSGFEQKSDFYEVDMGWNGRSIGVDKKGIEPLIIPGKKIFRLTDHRVFAVNDSENYIILYFSAPLAENQNLDGLIQFSSNINIKTTIEYNQIKVYPDKMKSGQHELLIHQGIVNFNGDNLLEDVSIPIRFSAQKPQVRLITESGIYTGGTDLVIPFESISLAAVDVEIVRIFEDNILRFYQLNRTMKDANQLELVGRPVFRGSLDLDDSLNLYQWNRFNLNLSDYIKTEQGAIYHVNINFRRAQSLYPGAIHEGENPDYMAEMEPGEWDGPGVESSYWDYWSADYSWYDRDNPATDSYYARNRRRVSLSVLASEIGIIAKGQKDNKVWAILSNLNDGNPLVDADVEVYNYQLQLISKGKTNSQGMIDLECQSIPFILTAKHNGQSNYLRIDRGSSLSISNFDVEGLKFQDGLKGFIYGERGVWRPGDPIYLTFILEKWKSSIPDDIPVVFELLNPLGQVEDRQVARQGTLGVYPFQTSTVEQDSTGHWTARVRVGDQFYTRNIPIETVKPNRLRVLLTPEAEIFNYENSRDSLSMDIQSNWLHGAPAKDLRALVELSLRSCQANFSGYSDYSFNDPTIDFSEPKRSLFDDRLDEQGFGNFNFNMKVRGSASSALTAVFSSRVFEEGGDFSINEVAFPFYPYESYVGVRTPPGDESRGMLLTDEDHIIDIVTLDSQGNPVDREGIKLKLYKMKWRWWWDKSQENLTNFLSRSGTTLADQGTLDTINGKGSWELRINYPQWGRYLLLAEDPVSKHRSAKIIYLDWPGWAGAPQRGGDSSSILSVYTNEKSYSIDDTILVNIPSSLGGRALVSVEKGDQVIHSEWVETQEKMTTIGLRATSEMSPNVYIHVTLVQPLESHSNDSPIRMYGITPVEVINPATRLEPVIKMSDSLIPDTSFQIAVSEEQGKGMVYTVAVVDEGLLDLTNFDTPQPWDYFYSREALSVRTWDMYSEVYGSFSGDFGSSLSTGGSDSSINKSKMEQNRFTPVVIYEGPFILKEGETRTHMLEMPHYVGSVRAMVVATDGRGSYGSEENAVPVKQSLMVQGTLPRKAGPDETISFPVVLFGEEGNNPITLELETSSNLEIAGSYKQIVNIGDSGEEMVFFTVKTGKKLDEVEIRINASDGVNQSYWESKLTILPHNQQRSSIEKFILQGGESKDFLLNYFGLPGSNSAYAEFSVLPPIDLERRSKWLIRYPHGCIEQTISSVFPQLFLSSMKKLSRKEYSEVQRNVNAAIKQLSGFQLPSGGFSYWPGQSDANDWGTSYAGHFLLEAKKKGYHVPDTMISDWAVWQKELANNWRGDDFLNQAYRLYTLALYGDAPSGPLNRLREHPNLSTEARWRLAAAYALAGKNSVALNLVKNLSWTFKNYVTTSQTYGSSLRDKAMVLETMGLLDMNEESVPLIEKISDALGSEERYSTQTIAYSLISLGKYYGNVKVDSFIDMDYRIDQEEWTTLNDSSLISGLDLNEGINSFSLKNHSSNPLYISLMTTGIPAPGEEQELFRDFEIQIDYHDNQGNMLNPKRLLSGQDLVMEVKITNTSQRNMEDIALSAQFPSGWEILNKRENVEQRQSSSDLDYQDIRDDRIHTYFDIRGKEDKTFRFYLNAAYRGAYYFPGLICEDMYNPDSYAYTKGFFVEVN